MNLDEMNLDIDLKTGVVPISKAASSLAALIKRSRANHQPIIVTQKGYPTGVIVDVEVFEALRNLAGQGGTSIAQVFSELGEELVEDDEAA